MLRYFPRLTALLLILTLARNAPAQITLDDVQLYLVNPTDSKVSDLDALRSIFKGKQVVLLGEQAHSEGSVFEEKVRLIKFMHQELGFNIIAFESGLYDCYKALEDAQSENSISPMQESVLGIWSDARELIPLFEYILASQQTNSPLRLAGFDGITSSRYKDVFWQELMESASLSRLEKSSLEPVLFGTAEHLVEADSSAVFLNLLETVQRRLPANTASGRFLKMAFEIWSQEIQWQLDELQGKQIMVQNPRDKWMADGLLFLANEYSDGKIMAWGASYHFAYDASQFENTDLTKAYAESISEMNHDEDAFDLDSVLNGAIPMGQYLKEELEVFSLAFTSWEGTYQMLGDDHLNKIITPPEESFEYLINEQTENAIVLLENDSSWFYASALGHLPIFARWPQMFDGIYFMRELRPPTHVRYERKVKTRNATNAGKVYGRIVDSQTLKPIPYVTIQFRDTQRGVASNAVGEFELNEAMASRGIIISSIGYESDTVMLSGTFDPADFQIMLEPKSFLLTEVVIRDKPLSAKEILKKAKKAVLNNYSDFAYNQEVYYSMINRREDSLLFNEQGSVLMYFPNGYQPKARSYGEILQYRFEEASRHQHDGMGLLWLMFSHDLILDNDNILSRTNAYDYKIERVLAFQDRLVYDISFICKRPTAFTTGYGYPAPEAASGHIYIATDDFAILKYDICVERQSYTPKREQNLVQYPRHHHLSQSFRRHKGSYVLQQSFAETEVTTTFPDTGVSIYNVQNQFLTSMEIESENVTELTRPVLKLTTGSKVKQDSSFYNSHGYIVDQERRFDFYCSSDQPGQ